MTATGHGIIGAVIATQVNNPFIAIPLAFVSHIAADAFPHWDTGTNRKNKSHTVFFAHSFIDLSLSLVLPYLMVKNLFPQTDLFYLYTVVLASQFLDWISVPYVFFNWKSPPFSWPYRFQLSFDNKMDKPWGIIGQIAILIFLIVFAKLLH
jgi:hypothetical protein